MPSPEVSTSRISSSISAPSKVSPRMARSSSAEMRPLPSSSKRWKVRRRTSSCTFTRPSSAAARNSVYSISSLLSESKLLKRLSASELSIAKLSLRTAFISWSVMLPRFCASIRRNWSRSSSCSSVDRHQAIMQSAARRKCEARAKFRKHPRMSASMFCAAPVRCRPLIQGCSRACAAESRASGSSTSKDWTKSCASGESLKKRGVNWRLQALILLRISLSPPGNTGLPVSSMYAMMPIDHMSACTV
mmetsp:Transcript_147630/g.411191  ORF Transcript_147630/g.411191 Transcript_147630/m.411191 type:complete len:247 (-) Transcript_147630:670-1410(-)